MEMTRLDNDGLDRMQNWIWSYAPHLGFARPSKSADKWARDLDLLEAKWITLHKTHPREAHVLSVRFGLQGERHDTLVDVAVALGCPKGSVGGLVHRSLAKLKEARAARKTTFLDSLAGFARPYKSESCKRTRRVTALNLRLPHQGVC